MEGAAVPTRARRARPPALAAWTGALLAALMLATPVSAASGASIVLASGLPAPALTPGVTNPVVTQRTIKTTICRPNWTRTIRPSTAYTTALKVKQLAQYGFRDRNTAHYEEDHFISLELGGAPTNPRNLWPEPYHVKTAGQPDVGAYTKDRFEDWLHRQVCAGRLSLASAQLRITRNWVKYWRSASSP